MSHLRLHSRSTSNPNPNPNPDLDPNPNPNPYSTVPECVVDVHLTQPTPNLITISPTPTPTLALTLTLTPNTDSKPGLVYASFVLSLCLPRRLFVFAVELYLVPGLKSSLRPYNALSFLTLPFRLLYSHPFPYIRASVDCVALQHSSD
jgi:hypothetical protein